MCLPKLNFSYPNHSARKIIKKCALLFIDKKLNFVGENFWNANFRQFKDALVTTQNLMLKKSLAQTHKQ